MLYQNTILQLVLLLQMEPLGFMTGNNLPPEHPIVPGFNLNMIFLAIFSTTAVLIIRRKKYSKN